MTFQAQSMTALVMQQKCLPVLQVLLDEKKGKLNAFNVTPARCQE